MFALSVTAQIVNIKSQLKNKNILQFYNVFEKQKLTITEKGAV